MPPIEQRYNDAFRGWPVRPHDRQHPIRGSFLDPRPDPALGAVYHTGVDIAVRDDRPESGAPQGRTHRVYAIEGGVVEEATPRGVCGNVRVGHFGYGHVDALVAAGQRVQAGQHIGWTCRGWWHLHLTEWAFTGDKRLLVNPLRPAGKLKPFQDTAPPVIHEVRFHTPAEPAWGRRVRSFATLPHAGRRLNRTKLAGLVDVRAHISDPQSFIGWFRDVPALAAPHHPYRVGLLLVDRRTRRVVYRRTAFLSLTEPSLPAGQHYAPGTPRTSPRKPASTVTGPATASTGSGSSHVPTGTRPSCPTAVISSSSAHGTPQETVPARTSRSRSPTRRSERH